MYELLDNCLDKRSEGDGLVASNLLVIQEEGQLGNTLGISLRLKLVALLLKECLQVLVVGDNAVMDNGELVTAVRPVGMGVDGRGDAVSGPTGVRHTDMGSVETIHVDLLLLSDELGKGNDLADLLEEENLRTVFLITINSNTSGVITTVLETGETVEQDLNDFGTLLISQVVEVSKDATHFGSRYRLAVVLGSCIWLPDCYGLFGNKPRWSNQNRNTLGRPQHRRFVGNAGVDGHDCPIVLPQTVI